MLKQCALYIRFHCIVTLYLHRQIILCLVVSFTCATVAKDSSLNDLQYRALGAGCKTLSCVGIILIQHAQGV